MPCGKDNTHPVHSAVVFANAATNEPGSSSAGGDLIDVGEKLLAEGLVYMENVRMPADICVRYSNAQKAAMGSRKNIWRYGDFREDDE